MYTCGPGSVVGIATAYGRDGPGIEILVGVRFSAPVQTGPEAHPAPCTMGTGSFPGVKVKVKAVCWSYSTAALRHIVLLPE